MPPPARTGRLTNGMRTASGVTPRAPGKGRDPAWRGHEALLGHLDARGITSLQRPLARDCCGTAAERRLALAGDPAAPPRGRRPAALQGPSP
eukprot:2519449-Pyramimonas_sp.AAC.1